MQTFTPNFIKVWFYKWMHFLMHWGPVLINVNRPTKLQKRQSSQQAENNKMTTKWFKKCSSLLVGYKHFSELTGLSCTLNFFVCVKVPATNLPIHFFIYSLINMIQSIWGKSEMIYTCSSQYAILVAIN